MYLQVVSMRKCRTSKQFIRALIKEGDTHLGHHCTHTPFHTQQKSAWFRLKEKHV
jgi:hypothetical protein